MKQAVSARIDEVAALHVCSVEGCEQSATVFTSPPSMPSQGQLTAGDRRAQLTETLESAVWFCGTRHRAQSTGRAGAYASHHARSATTDGTHGTDHSDGQEKPGSGTGSGSGSGMGSGVVSAGRREFGGSGAAVPLAACEFEGSVFFFSGPWTADRVARVNRECHSYTEAVAALIGRSRGGADIRKLRAATAYYTALDPQFPQPAWLSVPATA